NPPTAAGTYRWIASPSSDANYTAISGSCNDSLVSFTTLFRSPAIQTTASGTVTIGSAISDSATISGLQNPTGAGTITFKLYGPNDTNCTGELQTTLKSAARTPNGTNGSGTYPPAAPRTSPRIA